MTNVHRAPWRDFSGSTATSAGPFRRRVGPGKQNGELLQLAENEFDVLVTLDTNLRYQQNLMRRKIAIVMIRALSNRLADLGQHFPACAQALKGIKPRDFVDLGAID